MFRRKKRFGGYTVEGVALREERNWGLQLVMALLLGVFFFGPFGARLFGYHMSIAALGVAVAIDILLLVALAVWALRRWNY